jgi:hypothetical protein
VRPLLRCNGREAETVAFSVYSNSDSERAFPASRFRRRSQNSDGSDGAIRVGVMDHVSRAGKDVECAGRQFFVQAQGCS